MNETLKACRRRYCETFRGDFDWNKVFRGRGIDVGCGPCPLPYPDVTPFDTEQGDCNHLSSYFNPSTFDYLHASQVLEHMHDPKKALKDWLKVVRPTGWVVLTFPSMELYGDIEWGEKGSKFNGDHKSTFSVHSKTSQCPQHIYIPDWVLEISESYGASVKLWREVDSNYDRKIGYTQDQTWPECDMVEAWIEMAIQKNKARIK